jgi:hypothetical protein
MPEPHQYTVSTARAAAERDELSSWLAEFLASPGSDNAALADKLAGSHPFWTGPVEVQLDDLKRLAGGPGTPALVQVDEEEWRDDVEDLAQKVGQDDFEPPPLIATQQHNGDLLLEDGNHRAEALRRCGERTAWTVIGFERAEERDQFDGRSRRDL